MYAITNSTFYTGLTVGIIIGIVFDVAKSYICKNQQSSRFFGKSVDDGSSQTKNTSTKEDGNEEFKMALLVRHDLKMGKGKVAAQCSHAIVHCYEKSMRLTPREINGWESNNKPIDIFKVADEQTMLEYQQLAIKKELNTYIVIDAGRTQVAPRSKTVMAIGPAKREQIDLFTQSLQCAVATVIAYNKSKLRGLPSKCARIVLRVPDLKTLESIQYQCKLYDICIAAFMENKEMTVLAIGPANEVSINALVHNLKLY